MSEASNETIKHGESVFNIAPITAVSFFEDDERLLLFVGEGSFLKVYDVNTKECIATSRVFTRERIHGIKRVGNSSNVIVWGGKSILSISAEEALVSRDLSSRSQNCGDWIFHATHAANSTLAAITARNDLLIKSQSGSENFELLAQLAGERCTLYCARVEYYAEEGRFLIGAGTVFGEILVWSASYPSSKGSVRLHYRLLGHEGSIFDISFTENVRTSSQEKRYLASCSNDRTVRVWEITHEYRCKYTDQEDLLNLENKEKMVPEFAESNCLAVGWAHNARIWRVMFTKVGGPEDIEIASASEDLSSVFWHIRFNKDTLSLVPRESHLLHEGKSIWSMDLFKPSTLLATGGADGRVNVLNYASRKSVLRLKFQDLQALEKSSWDSSSVDKPVNLLKDTFSQYAPVDRDQIAFTTVDGGVHLHSLQKEEWIKLRTQRNLVHYSVLSSWYGLELLVLGDKDGNINIFDIKNPSEDLLGWKEDLRPGAFYTASQPDKLYLLVTSISEAKASLSEINHPPTNKRTDIPLPVPDGFSRIKSAYIDCLEKLLFICSERGQIAIFEFGSSLRLLRSTEPLNGHRSIDYIGRYYIPGSSDYAIVTGNRGGLYSIMKFCKHSYELEEMHSSVPPNCRILAGAYQSPSDSTFHVYGFRGHEFFVRDETHGMEVFSEVCGGTHRCWAISPPINSPGYFVWTKASVMNLLSPLPRTREVIKMGLHGREIKSLAVSGDRIATGAEDTILSISEFNKSSLQTKKLFSIKQHATGIHGLKYSICGTYLFSSGGQEELLAWKVTPLGLIYEAAAPVFNKIPDLRIESFDTVKVRQPASARNLHAVVAAYSDSSVRVFLYNPILKKFRCVYEAPRKDPPVCLTQAVLRAVANRTFLFLAGTNSYVQAWDLTAEISSLQYMDDVGRIPQTSNSEISSCQILDGSSLCKWSDRLHQNSVKSFAVHAVPQSEHKLALFCGGDDGAVSVTILDTSSWIATSTITHFAHAAAVGALQVLELLPDKATFTSFGGDRKVIVWHVKLSETTVSMEDVSHYHSGVYDISGAQCLGDGLEEGSCVVVVGVGLEVWRFFK